MVGPVNANDSQAIEAEIEAIYQDIKERLDEVRQRIATAARCAGRSEDEIILVGVSKTHPAATVAAAVRAGLRDVGENRVQEAADKFAELTSLKLPPFRRHMVGHLQRNKVRLCHKLFDLIQSVDSIRLARALDRNAQERGACWDVLLEVNVGGEESKFGVPPEHLGSFAREVSSLANVRVLGLMTVPPYRENPRDVRPYFARLRELFAQVAAMQLPRVEMRYLSMGMSHDFEVAIEEGANMVRIGTALFGSREEEEH